MGLLSNLVQRSELQQGDHIYCYRKLHIYSHHGIYVEADRVIHYTRTKVVKKPCKRRHQCKNCGHIPKAARGVVKTCVDCFLGGHKLYRFEYDVSFAHFVFKKSGTCTTGSSDSADEVIRRARDLLMGFGEYNLFENNCETFAIYCKTNKHMSGQAFAAQNWGKYAFKFFIMHNIDRLLHDVSVHHPSKHMQLKQTIETTTETLITLKEIIVILTRLNAEDGNDVDEDDQLINECLLEMEQGGGLRCIAILIRTLYQCSKNR